MNRTPQLQPLKNKSNKFPSPNLNPNLGAFLTMTTCEIHRLKHVSLQGNLSDLEIQALTSLTNQYQLTMMPPDKGGNIVLYWLLFITTMCKRILSNKDWYKPIPRPLIEKFSKKLYSLVHSAYFNNIINKHGTLYSLVTPVSLLFTVHQRSTRI